MIMNCDREIFFSVLLADDVLVEVFLYLPWGWHFTETKRGAFEAFSVLLNYVMAQVDAFRADKYIVRPFDKGINLATGASAEVANYSVFFIFRCFSHYNFLLKNRHPVLDDLL